MRQATTREARFVVKSVLGDRLARGVGNTWTDKVERGKARERRVGMALVWDNYNAEALEYELNFWMKACGYTNEVTVSKGTNKRWWGAGRQYVRFKALLA